MSKTRSNDVSSFRRSKRMKSNTPDWRLRCRMTEMLSAYESCVPNRSGVPFLLALTAQVKLREMVLEVQRLRRFGVWQRASGEIVNA